MISSGDGEDELTGSVWMPLSMHIIQNAVKRNTVQNIVRKQQGKAVIQGVFSISF